MYPELCYNVHSEPRMLMISTDIMLSILISKSLHLTPSPHTNSLLKYKYSNRPCSVSESDPSHNGKRRRNVGTFKNPLRNSQNLNWSDGNRKPSEPLSSMMICQVSCWRRTLVGNFEPLTPRRNSQGSRASCLDNRKYPHPNIWYVLHRPGILAWTPPSYHLVRCPLSENTSWWSA